MARNIVVEKLRPGFVGQTTTIFDEFGTAYEAVQSTRGPALGVIVAVGKEDGKFTLGWSFLSPNEPISISKDDGVKEYTNSKTGAKGKYNAKKLETNIDWKKATERAILRAEGGEVNPLLKMEFLEQVKRFRRRAFAYFNPIDVAVI
jgi:hypothetical protein